MVIDTHLYFPSLSFAITCFVTAATGSLKVLRFQARSNMRPDREKRKERPRPRRMNKNLFGWFLLTFLILTAFGSVYSQEARVHYGDVIDVDFVGGFEFDWRGGLTPEGYLNGLDAVDGPIYGLCLTEGEVAAAIKKVYSKILRNPEVVVRIIDKSNRALVRLSGAVKSPARFKLMRVVSLRELLIISGGFTDAVSGEISIFRPKNASCSDASSAENPSQSNPLQTMIVKISELLKGLPSANPLILSGDIIEVGSAPVIYVIGAVNNPRPIFSREQLTVSRAIATAGGLAKESDGKKVTIIRREGPEIKNIDVDLVRIKRGESEDAILKPFDIIDVASKGRGKRKYPPVEANAHWTTNLAEPPLRVID